jgi:AAA ATPase domain/Adenylate and Guanylate cyclase catalytic domain
VRAALSIQRALAELNSRNAAAGKPQLKARIGLEAGPVVVDAAGEIFGEVPNVAARVQAIAEPGTVLITAQVQRQIAGLFVAEECGSHTLKGVPAPVTLYRIVRASGGGRRSGRRHLAPLIGRDEEMAMLLRRWERARQGDGQFILIVGEPGLGKSRLLDEFRARLRETPHTWAEWSCLQLLQSTPLHPIAEWGRTRFGGADVPAERRLAELESSLAQVRLNPAENVPLLGDAWRCVNEAITAAAATKLTWCEAESHRVAGEIALKSPEADAPKAQAHFERALTVARAQQAKSWELRAAMSMARLLRDQGKRDEARDLLAPVYGWFTEGFDTLDLKDAKALLEVPSSASQ